MRIRKSSMEDTHTHEYCYYYPRTIQSRRGAAHNKEKGKTMHQLVYDIQRCAHLVTTKITEKSVKQFTSCSCFYAWPKLHTHIPKELHNYDEILFRKAYRRSPSFVFFSLSSEIQGEKPDGSWRLQKRRRKLRDMLGNGRKALKHFARTYICREGCKCMCKNVCNNAHTHNTSVSWTTVNGTCKCLSAMILNQCTISRGDDNNNFNVVDYWQLHRLNSLSVAFVVVP